jgi:hypothetical protein
MSSPKRIPPRRPQAYRPPQPPRRDPEGDGPPFWLLLPLVAGVGYLAWWAYDDRAQSYREQGLA